MLHILYTQEEGGDFHSYISKISDEETRQLYEDTVKSGILMYQVGDRIIKIKPAYIALGEVKEDYDFILGKTRLGARKAAETKKEGENDQ
jgi:hypothetical protein